MGRKLILLAVGLGLVALVLGETDLHEVLRRSLGVGWGLLLLVALYFAAFLADTVAWQITLPPVPRTAGWLYRIWKVRMVGEALNLLIPAAGLGGEPAKAVLLRRHYGIAYRDGVTSLILSQTIIVIAMVLFQAAAFALILASDALRGPFSVVGGIGLAVVAAATAAVFLLPHLRPSAFVSRRLRGARAGARIAGALRALSEIESGLIAFYARHRGRFVTATTMSLLSWLIGVPEIYYGAWLLGHPVSWSEAWIVEAAVQMVRAGAFFLPAGLGAQEGAYLFTVSAIGGTPTLGVALAMLRRFREVFWILWGLLIALLFSAAPAPAPAGLTGESRGSPGRHGACARAAISDRRDRAGT